MQRFSINNILKDYVYGFDLDGTLYDEFDFISQVYAGVAKYISQYSRTEEDEVYKKICTLWLQYGSSKYDLFQQFFAEFGVVPTEEQIKDCLKIYRTAEFKLCLPNRTKIALDQINEAQAKKFLLTDGNSDLQRRKIKALGLERWFKETEIFISGDYGVEYQKPSTLIRSEIENKIGDLSKAVYFGDRDIDEIFAERMKFDFCKVHSMKTVL